MTWAWAQVFCPMSSSPGGDHGPSEEASFGHLLTLFAGLLLRDRPTTTPSVTVTVNTEVSGASAAASTLGGSAAAQGSSEAPAATPPTGTAAAFASTPGTAAAASGSAQAPAATAPEPPRAPAPAGVRVSVLTGPPLGPPSTWRFYTVWRNPLEGAVETEGIWCGPHPATWDTLCSRLRGGTYPTSGARLRRANGPADALQLWYHGGPRPSPENPPRYFVVELRAVQSGS